VKARGCQESSDCSNHMKTAQFRWIGPIILTDFDPDELELIRNAASIPGSKLKHIILRPCKSDGETRTQYKLYAKAIEKLSAVMWRKQLGCERLNGMTITQLVGTELATLTQATRTAQQASVIRKQASVIRKQSTRNAYTQTEETALYVPLPVQQEVCRVFTEVGAETLSTLEALRRDQITAGNTAGTPMHVLL
jgi:hypothetical protein